MKSVEEGISKRVFSELSQNGRRRKFDDEITMCLCRAECLIKVWTVTPETDEQSCIAKIEGSKADPGRIAKNHSVMDLIVDASRFLKSVEGDPKRAI